jgi:2'-5' RNA ligase
VARIRTFVAIDLPVALVRQVAELQRQLRDRAREAGVRIGWVPPPNMHLTLKFLGNIQPETVPAISDKLRELLAPVAPIKLAVEGLGAFPDAGRPRVLWAGLSGELEALSTLAEGVDRTLEALGFNKESRPFHAHVTLGRVKGGPAGQLLVGLEDPRPGQFTVREVVLYQSELQRQGASYTPLARFPLSGS